MQPDRRGLAPGARWQVTGPNTPSWFRKPQMNGTLLVLDVVPMSRIAFQLSAERIDAELSLSPRESAKTDAQLAVEAPWLAVRRSFPNQALGRLYDLVQTAGN